MVKHIWAAVVICTLTGREIGWSRGNPTPIDEYDNLYKQWNPENFDAREWVQVVKETGARYVVFLTKHHDGFCLFDTEHTARWARNGRGSRMTNSSMSRNEPDFDELVRLVRCPDEILGSRWVSGTALAAGGVRNRRLAPCRSQPAASAVPLTTGVGS